MKKTLAILLSLALIICMIPGTAFAEAGATEPAAPISIEDAEVIFDKEAYTYTGSEIKPTSITLKLSDVSSVNAAATKFDIAYSDNITDVGTVTVTITAKAESGYTGTAEGTYEIKPLDLSDGSVEVTVGSQLETVTDNTFNWGNVTFYINKTLNTSLLKEGNLKVAVSTEENGTKKATFSSNSKDFITNEISAIFVTKPNIGDKVTAKVTSKHTYDGTEQNVTVSFTKIDSSDKTALPSASDYEIVYGGDRTSAGEQTITIIGKNNFAGAITDSIKYTIGKRDSSKVSIEPIPNQVAGADHFL